MPVVVLAMLLGFSTLGASPAPAQVPTLEVVTDDGGSNDPSGDGQNDLTQLKVDESGSDFLEVTWSWDEPSAITGGGQAVNACALFDTDGDGLIDNAFCLEVQEVNGEYVITDSGNGTDSVKDYPVWMACTEGNDVRCAQAGGGGRLADPYLNDLAGSSCTVTEGSTDPFAGDGVSTAGTPGGAGDDYPVDLTSTCRISYDLIGDGELTNVCSYPSAGNDGNNNPFDCVITPGAARLTIIKDAGDDTSTTFSFSSNRPSIDGDSSWSVVGSGSAVTSESFAVGGNNPNTVTLTETIPDDWQLDSVTCLDGNGEPTGSADLATGVVSGIQLDSSLETVCTFVNSEALQPPNISLTKTAGPTSLDEPGGPVTFTVEVTNSGDAGTIDSLVDDIHGDLALSCLDSGGVALVSQTIDSGQTLSCTFTADVTGMGDYVETDTVTAVVSNGAGSSEASDTATVTINDVPAVPLSIVKTVTSAASLPEPGGDFEFQVVVTNGSTTDTATVTDLDDTYLDDLQTAGSCSDEDGNAVAPYELSPGESLTCTFTVPHADIGEYINSVTVAATDDDGADVGGTSNNVTVTVTDVPSSIEVIKTASPTSVDEPGGNVTFSFVINNTSPVDLVTIESLSDSVYGDLNGRGDCSVPQILGVGASYSCSFTAFVAGNAGFSETNVVTATGIDDDGETVSDDDDATVTVNDVPSSIETTKTASPTSVPETGGDVTYTVVVKNTSLVDTVTINSVVDSVFGDVSASCVPALPVDLAPGETVTCTFTEFISGNAGGSHVNVVTASGTDDDGNPVQDDDQEEVPFDDVLPDITVTKTADPGSVPETGGDVTFTFEATNNATEDATLDSLVDSDFGDLNGQGTCSVPQPLAANGGNYTCSITVFLSGDASGLDHENVVTATASDDDGNTVEDTDDETVVFDDVLPDVSITKTADPTSVPETGATVEFTIVVTNNSLEDANIDSLVDSDFDLAFQCADAVGTVLAYEGTYTCVFTEFISGDASGPAHENTATVVASDGDGNTDTESDDATVSFTDVAPTITVSKTPDPTSVPETGAPVEFTIVVTNTSQENVTITALGDSDFDLSPECDDADGTVLDPGATYTCTFTETISGDAAGPAHENTVTANAVDNDGTSASAEDTATVTFDDVLPDISVIKTANPTEVPETGGDVTYTVEVTNNSTEAATLDSLVDDKFGSLSGQGDCATGGTIAPGATYTCSFTIAGLSGEPSTTHINEVKASASDNDTNTATDSDDATVTFIDVLPDVSITKTANPTSVDEPGADVEFTIEVTNNSPEAATIDTLTDTDFALGVHCPDAVGTVLASGQSYTCVFTEFIAGNVGEDHQNTATVVASDNDGKWDTESDSADVTINDVAPAVSIVKEGPASIDEGGDSASYDIAITNDSVSSDPLTITSLNDDQFGDLLPEAEAANGGPITLNPGDLFTFQITRSLTLDVGETHTNVVTVVGTDDEGTTATNNDDHTVGATNVDPSIVVTKTASQDEVFAPGEDVTFTIAVTNASVPTDPVTMDSLTDTVFGDITAECGLPQTINPGDTWTCDITRTISEDHTNVVTASGADDDGTPVSGSDDASVGYLDPSIDIVKNWNLLVDDDSSETVTEGDTIEYTFDVTNDGNVPLLDVTVTDQLPGLSDITCTPAQGSTLLPGETMTCSATYVVTEADVIAGKIDNTATASSEETETDDESDLVTVPVDNSFRGCTYTQGYWRTHNANFGGPGKGKGASKKGDDTWDLIVGPGLEGDKTVGPNVYFLDSTHTYYDVLWSPTSMYETKWLILARQYIAAELNRLSGATSVDIVADEPLLQDSRDLLNDLFNGGEWTAEEEARALEIAEILDLYNNGEIGPGHCD